jgi:hypothetical protein
MIMDFGIASVAAITVIAYLIGAGMQGHQTRYRTPGFR